MPNLSGIFGDSRDREYEEAQEAAWSIVHNSDPTFVPRSMTINDEPFAVELGPRMTRVFNMYIDPDEFLEICADYGHLMDVEYVGEMKTLVLRLHCEPAPLLFPERVILGELPENWERECGEYGRVEFDSVRYLPVRGYRLKDTTASDRSLICANRFQCGGQSQAASAGEAAAATARHAPSARSTRIASTARAESTDARARYDWVKQAELVRALNRVLGVGEAPNKSTLTRAVQNGLIQSNGESARRLLLQVDSVKAWLTRVREMDHVEVQQVVDAVIAEIRVRTQ